MKSLGFAAYGAGVTIATLFAAPLATNAIAVHSEGDATSVRLWALWLAASISPLVLSAAAWMAAKIFTLRWLPHIIFVPIAIVIYFRGMAHFLRVSAMDIHDGPAGDASLLGNLFLALSLLVHLFAFARTAVSYVKV